MLGVALRGLGGASWRGATVPVTPTEFLATSSRRLELNRPEGNVETVAPDAQAGEFRKIGAVDHGGVCEPDLQVGTVRRVEVLDTKDARSVREFVDLCCPGGRVSVTDECAVGPEPVQQAAVTLRGRPRQRMDRPTPWR